MNTHSSPIPLRPDPAALASSQRRSFIRACTALARANVDRQRPETILKAWPDDVIAGRILKAAQEPTTSESFAWMQATKVLPLLAPSAASMKLLALAEPIDLSGVVSVGIPYIGQAGRPAVVPFVSEGKPMPIVNMRASTLRVGPTKKLLIGSALTNELQSGSADNAARIIGDALAVSCEQSMDGLLFSDTAATEAAPAGILDGVVAIPASGTSGLQGIADDLALLAQAIANVGISADDMIVVTTPSLATKLRVLASPKLDNVVLSSPSIPAGEVIAIAQNGLATGYDGGVSIEISDQATLHMEDTAPIDISIPGAPAVVASPVKSTWQTDSLAVKVRGWVAWAVHTGAVAYLTGAAW